MKQALEGFEGIEGPVRRFIEQHAQQRQGWKATDRARRYSPLGYLIRAAFQQLPGDEPLGTLAPALKIGSVDLYALAVGKPQEFNLHDHTQYILGYLPSDIRFVPQDGADRVVRWHRVLGEAFALTGEVQTETWTDDEYNDFVHTARQLIAEIAAITVDCDECWNAITRVEPGAPGH